MSKAPQGRYADEPMGGDTTGMTAQERKDTAYRRRRAFLRNIGLPGARVTNGRPDRPSNRPEARAAARRRHYIRNVAAEFGISLGAAEALTPRRPRNGRRVNVARDEAGRFTASNQRAGLSPAERE